MCATSPKLLDGLSAVRFNWAHTGSMTTHVEGIHRIPQVGASAQAREGAGTVNTWMLEATTSVTEPRSSTVSREIVQDLRPHAPQLVAKIVEQIQHDVTAYAGRADGRRGRLIDRAVSSAVDHFLDLLEGGPSSPTDVHRLFQQLGRAEALSGRDLDSIRAAYQIATRSAWAEMKQLVMRHDVHAESLATLTDALFAYMQQLTDQVAIGHQASQPAPEHPSSNARRDLTSALLRGTRDVDIDALAADARWTIPTRIVVITAVLHAAHIAPKACQFGAAVLSHVEQRTDHWVLALVMDATQSSRIAQDISGRHRFARAAVSWPVELVDARHAYLWNRRALNLAARGLIGDERIIDCSRHRQLLWLHADPALARHASEGLLEPLSHETPHNQAVLAETLLMWLRTRASAPVLAERLGVHQQTIRHRIRRLRAMFGDTIDDPQQVLSLMIALEVSMARQPTSHIP